MDLERIVDEARAAASEVLDEEHADLAPAEAIRHLANEVERLRPLADDGRAYRQDLVAEALAEGVRANGEEFAEETYRAMLESADIATVKRMRDDWARLAEKRFPGGRQSGDEDEGAPGTQPAQEERELIPDEAYQG